MRVYRFSASSVDDLVRKASRQALIVPVLAIFVGFGIAGYFNPDMFSLQVFPILLLIVAPIVFFTMRGQRARMTAIIKSTEIELDEDELIARSSFGTVVLPKAELTELKHTPTGIVVKGRTAMQSMHLKRELKDFDQLAAQLESWAPPQVTRTQGAAWTASTNIGLALANLILFACAFLVTNPTIAIICCLLESVILVACGVLTWRFFGASSQKWGALVLFFPIMSLISRALMLWPAND